MSQRREKRRRAARRAEYERDLFLWEQRKPHKLLFWLLGRKWKRERPLWVDYKRLPLEPWGTVKMEYKATHFNARAYF